jgi:hypothetical protein
VVVWVVCALEGPGPSLVLAVGLGCGSGGGASDPGGRGGGGTTTFALWTQAAIASAVRQKAGQKCSRLGPASDPAHQGRVARRQGGECPAHGHLAGLPVGEPRAPPPHARLQARS